MVDADPAPDLALLFRRIAYALCEAVADHIRRDRNSGPMLGLITKSLFSKMRRFAALVARFRSGAVFPPLRPRRRAARPEAAASESMPPETAPEPHQMGESPPPTGPALHLPRKKAWLTVMMPWVVALYAIRLRAFVEEPETAAFLAACPQARAILRDLWWALSSDPLPEALRPDVILVGAGAPAVPEVAGQAQPLVPAGRAAPDGGSPSRSRRRRDMRAGAEITRRSRPTLPA